MGIKRGFSIAIGYHKEQFERDPLLSCPYQSIMLFKIISKKHKNDTLLN